MFLFALIFNNFVMIYIGVDIFIFLMAEVLKVLNL